MCSSHLEGTSKWRLKTITPTNFPADYSIYARYYTFSQPCCRILVYIRVICEIHQCTPRSWCCGLPSHTATVAGTTKETMNLSFPLTGSTMCGFFNFNTHNSLSVSSLSSPSAPPHEMVSFPFTRNSLPAPPSSTPSPSHRGVKWIYLGVIATAPSVHIMVSLYRTYPKLRKVLFFGITAATVTAWFTRVGFMYESGFMFDPFPKWEE